MTRTGNRGGNRRGGRRCGTRIRLVDWADDDDRWNNTRVRQLDFNNRNHGNANNHRNGANRRNGANDGNGNNRRNGANDGNVENGINNNGNRGNGGDDGVHDGNGHNNNNGGGGGLRVLEFRIFDGHITCHLCRARFPVRDVVPHTRHCCQLHHRNIQMVLSEPLQCVHCQDRVSHLLAAGEHCVVCPGISEAARSRIRERLARR